MGISFRGWLSQLADDFRNSHSYRWSILRGAFYAYLGLWHTVTSRYPVGTNVFEREWDALVVLDACRVDALRAVSDEYDFLDEVDSIWSVGSTSHEWVSKTFTGEWRDEIRNTGYVTGNGYLYRTGTRRDYPPSGGSAPFGFPRWDVVDLNEFGLLDNVWQDGQDEELRTVPPWLITDRAVEAGRERDLDRLVVHYMQPHSPYIADAVDGRRVRAEAVEHVEPLGEIRRGTLDEDVAWECYLDNLRLVLDEVEVLLENLDADRVVISADHGELFGEWGEYGHPDGLPHPNVKKVPWVVTTATDTCSYTPDVEPSEQRTSVEEHLADLGYVV